MNHADLTAGLDATADAEATRPASGAPPGIDLTAPHEELSSVQEHEQVDWSEAGEPAQTPQDAWWVDTESRTAALDQGAAAPPAATADIDCASCAGMAASQFLLPVQIPAGAESEIAAVDDQADAGTSNPDEPEWLSPAPELEPMTIEVDSAFAGATKPLGATAVPATDDAYSMGPGRASRPLPNVSRADHVAGQPPRPGTQMPRSRSAGNITTSSIELAALLQDLEPITPGGPALPGGDGESSPTAADFPATDNGEAQTSAPGDAAAANGGAGEISAEQTLGEAPEESDEPLQFLRRQTVLLEPGEHQLDVGISYLNDTSDFPVLITDGMNFGVVRGQTRQRLLSVPLELRVGIAPYTQAFVNVPFGWSNSEVSFNGSEFTEDEGGLGDVSAGVTKQIIMGNQYYPDVLASLAFSAPTGDSSLTTALGTPGSSLGQGFWTLTGSLSFIQTYDPLVFYYGLGYTFRFQNEFGDNIEIEPGDQVFYRFGAGFAVNPHVTLSAAFTGSVIGRDKVDGIEIGGSVREPMSLRLAATISRRKGSKTHSSFKLIEPYVNFGLNEDSIDTLFGISWTY